jgi:hypothetical protein
MASLVASGCAASPPEALASGAANLAPAAAAVESPPPAAYDVRPTPSPPTAPSPEASLTPATARAIPEGAIVVDHRSVELFEAIPEEYLQAAAALDMFFMDRSVGFNIHNSLDCLAFPSDEAAPSRCRRWEHVQPQWSADPARSGWSRPGGYDRSRWVFQTWPESDCATWRDEIRCFMEVMDESIGTYDVVSFQFSYLEVSPGSDIADPGTGFFSDDPGRMDAFDLRAYEAGHADQSFIYWTTSLARGIGSAEAVDFNEQMRALAIESGRPLFDVADILSHDPGGQPCFDNRDGVPYNNGNQSEDYPDDGLDLPAICPDYTTETDGGHLGRVAIGGIRVAKAFWVLMAQIAGWRP